ncbi:MAG: type II toxin-antitoxin system VapC family toxin [Parachlamydiaceae bacterium]|nr:type II toxin-antitoxin system VapC family toxin [Parachlamydiaceae bacterium]
MAWCFEDEGNIFTDNILSQMVDVKVIVPTIWPLEVANVLLLAERKKRVSSIQSASFMDALTVFSITVDPSTSHRAMHTILRLAEKTKLTIYDAAYLELAFREQIPLATLDKDLISAAKSMNISLL